MLKYIRYNVKKEIGIISIILMNPKLVFTQYGFIPYTFSEFNKNRIICNINLEKNLLEMILSLNEFPFYRTNEQYTLIYEILKTKINEQRFINSKKLKNE